MKSVGDAHCPGIDGGAVILGHGSRGVGCGGHGVDHNVSLIIAQSRLRYDVLCRLTHDLLDIGDRTPVGCCRAKRYFRLAAQGDHLGGDIGTVEVYVPAGFSRLEWCTAKFQLDASVLQGTHVQEGRIVPRCKVDGYRDDVVDHSFLVDGEIESQSVLKEIHLRSYFELLPLGGTQISIWNGR